MKFSVRSIFRVGGAIVVGAGLIGMALSVQHKTNADELAQVPAVIVAQGDARTVLPTLDSDGDGIPDWQETLNGTDPHAYTKQTPAASTPATTTDPYTPPTTITDKFAEQFLENMVRTSAGKTLTADEKAKLVTDSVSELAAQIQDKLYTQADIRSTAQNDLAAIREYGNALGDVFLTKSATHEPELMILDRATKQNNPEELKKLKPVEQAYAAMVQRVLAVETPSSLARQHVDLVNALSLIQSDIAAMQKVFSDPLPSLVHIRRYQDDGQNLFTALDNIRIALEKSGVVYTSGEAGLILFSLRP